MERENPRIIYAIPYKLGWTRKWNALAQSGPATTRSHFQLTKNPKPLNPNYDTFDSIFRRLLSIYHDNAHDLATEEVKQKSNFEHTLGILLTATIDSMQ